MNKYTVRNASLDKYFEEHEISNLYDLEDDDVKEIARDLNVNEISVNTSSSNFNFKFDKIATIKNIERANTFSLFIPQEYRTTKQSEQFEITDNKRRISRIETGEELTEMMSDLMMGLHNLKPKQSQDMLMSKSAMERWFTKIPAVTTGKLIITHENDEPFDLSALIVKNSNSDEGVSKYDLMSFFDLRKEARKFDFENVNSKTKAELVELLKNR